MTEEGYAEVDGAAYERLRKSLLREKGGDRQREFLAAARSSEQFLDSFLFFRLCQRPRSMPRGPRAAATGGALRWTPAMAIASGTHGRYHPRLA